MQLISNLFASVIAWFEEKQEEGQTLVEYALIIALVSVLLVGSLIALRGGIEGVFSDILAAFSGSS